MYTEKIHGDREVWCIYTRNKFKKERRKRKKNKEKKREDKRRWRLKMAAKCNSRLDSPNLLLIFWIIIRNASGFRIILD